MNSSEVGFIIIAIGFIAFLLLVIFSPFILAALVFRFFKNNRFRPLFVLASFTVPFFILYFTGFIGSSAARVKREHDLKVPRSASHLQCEEFVSLVYFMDDSALASFDMPRTELPAFLRQLKSFKADPDLQNNYMPAGPNHLNYSFRGTSSDSNFLYLAVYDLDATHVRIYLDTFWG